MNEEELKLIYLKMQLPEIPNSKGLRKGAL
jgi:hypothetical protein